LPQATDPTNQQSTSPDSKSAVLHSLVVRSKKVKENTIYSDSLVKVYENGIRLQNYYFPFGSKFVEFSDILGLDKKSATLLNGKWRIWGTSDFMSWFPLDWNRPRRDWILFLRLASQRMRIGFTVEDTERFIEIMKSKGVRIDNS